MKRIPANRLFLRAVACCAVLTSVCVSAQEYDDPNDMPLGDVARQLRKQTPLTKPVIDDDNLTQVMEQAETQHGFGGSAMRYLMVGDAPGFHVAVPDATCSLSFTPNVKSLLSTQYTQMGLPASEVAKIQAQATIEGDALTVPLFNDTNWHLSELDVALTIVRKAAPQAELGTLDASPIDMLRPEKKPDVTLIYRMRAPSAPWSRTVFSARLQVDLAPADEWHWAIVQVKGYPPQGFSPDIPQTTARAREVQTDAGPPQAGH